MLSFDSRRKVVDSLKFGRKRENSTKILLIRCLILLTLFCSENTFFSDFARKTNTTISTLCLLTQQVITLLTIPKSNTPELAVGMGELWKAIVIQYKRNSEMTSK